MTLLQLDGYDLVNTTEQDHDYHLHVTVERPTTICRHCYASEIVGFGRREQVVKDLPRLGKRTAIYVETRRWRCKSCGKTFFDRLPHVDERRQMTDRLVQWIGQEAVSRTFASIAGEIGVTEGTVRQVFSDYVQRRYAQLDFVTPRWLGIDEIYLIKPRCVMTNVEELTALDILENRNKKTVIARLSEMDRSRVELVTIDMWRPYRDAARIALRDAQVVIDKFHVVRMLNAACETVRKSLRSSLTKHQRRGLVNDRFLILKRERDLTDKDRMMLDGWLLNYPALAAAYETKEAGYRIYEAASSADAAERYAIWKASVPHEMRGAFGDFQRAWENWGDEILAYFDHRITNAYTESLNNLIRTTNRIGRGYSFEALRAKILLSENGHKIVRPKFQRIRSPDVMERRAFEPEPNLGVDLSTLAEILGKDEIDPDQL